MKHDLDNLTILELKEITNDISSLLKMLIELYDNKLPLAQQHIKQIKDLTQKGFSLDILNKQVKNTIDAAIKNSDHTNLINSIQIVNKEVNYAIHEWSQYINKYKTNTDKKIIIISLLIGFVLGAGVLIIFGRNNTEQQYQQILERINENKSCAIDIKKVSKFKAKKLGVKYY